jgi:hypothetical protein
LSILHGKDTLQRGLDRTSGGSPPGPEKPMEPDYGIAPDELQAAHHVYRLFTDLTVLEVVKIIFLGFD